MQDFVYDLEDPPLQVRGKVVLAPTEDEQSNLAKQRIQAYTRKMAEILKAQLPGARLDIVWEPNPAEILSHRIESAYPLIPSLRAIATMEPYTNKLINAIAFAMNKDSSFYKAGQAKKILPVNVKLTVRLAKQGQTGASVLAETSLKEPTDALAHEGDKALAAATAAKLDVSQFPTVYGTAEQYKKFAKEQEKQANLQAKCANCGRTDVTLRTCSQCQAVRYCSTECQRADWPKHKVWCKEHAIVKPT